MDSCQQFSPASQKRFNRTPVLLAKTFCADDMNNEDLNVFDGYVVIGEIIHFKKILMHIVAVALGAPEFF